MERLSDVGMEMPNRYLVERISFKYILFCEISAIIYPVIFFFSDSELLINQNKWNLGFGLFIPLMGLIQLHT